MNTTYTTHPKTNASVKQDQGGNNFEPSPTLSQPKSSSTIRLYVHKIRDEALSNSFKSRVYPKIQINASGMNTTMARDKAHRGQKSRSYFTVKSDGMDML